MVALKQILAALNAPGIISSLSLSFKQLKCKLAETLLISVDDAIFEMHKEAIKERYSKLFTKYRATSTTGDEIAAPVPKKAKKRLISHGEEEDGHRRASDEREERTMTIRKQRSASSSELLNHGGESAIADAAPVSDKPSKDFHRLTVAELKIFLADAGVNFDKFKRKSEYVAAAESVAPLEKDGNITGLITIASSEDEQSAQTSSALLAPSIVLISSSDDEEAPVLTVSRVTGGRALGVVVGTPASNRPPLSQPTQPIGTVSDRGRLMFGPVFDANGVEVEVDEDYRESNDVLYGRLSIKTVGIQHYRGVIHVQEAVFLIREPRNPYDPNAIRVDNISRVQIGHIAAKDGTAGALAPLMDHASPYKPRFEATLARQLAYSCDTTLDIFGLREHFTVVQSYLVSKRLFMTGGLSGSATTDSTEDVRMKVSKQVKSELDDMFSKMETEQTSEEAQKLLLQFVATGLVTTQLMEFQSVAITWMIDREIGDRLSPFYEERAEKGQRVFFCSVTNSSSSSAPNPVNGGILADDMGLGKTLSTLVLVAAMNYFRPGRKGTLIICPLSVISNWSDQIESHFQHGALSVYVHHGSSRDVDALDKFDVVISSYQTVASDFDSLKGKKKNSLFSFEWERVVLDEAHNIRNSSTKAFKAVYELKSRNKWCLTGTPLQNKAEDIHSLFQFLRLAPFEDKSTFMRFIGRPVQNGDPVGTSFLRTSLKSVCLRRTKALLGLKIPKKDEFVCEVLLNDDAQEVYETLFKSTAEIFKHFLASEAASISSIYQHVLEWLLRLRQCCLDPSLVPEARLNAAQKAIALAQENRGVKLSATKAKEMLAKLTEILSGNDGVEAMKVCSICYEDVQENNACLLSTCSHVFCETCLHTWLETADNKSSCPMCRAAFDRKDLLKFSTLEALSRVDDSAAPVLLSSKVLQTSAKISALIQELELMRASDPSQKALVFSSFTQFLSIIESHLSKAGFITCRFVGSMSQKQRADVMREFNKDGGPNVMVISLKAGNAGINLVRANHVYLMDPWWNTSVENQAADRVHRMGQTRDVRVVKFIIRNSIEQRILEIQQRKNALAGTITNAPSPHEAAAARMQDLQALLSE